MKRERKRERDIERERKERQSEIGMEKQYTSNYIIFRVVMTHVMAKEVIFEHQVI